MKNDSLYAWTDIDIDTLLKDIQNIEKLVLQKLRDVADVDASIYDQSLYSYLLNKFEDTIDDCYDSDADTDSED
jgi:hypothetical protein